MQKTRPGTLFLWVAWRVLLVQIYENYNKMLTGTKLKFF